MPITPSPLSSISVDPYQDAVCPNAVYENNTFRDGKKFWKLLEALYRDQYGLANNHLF